MSKIDKYLNEGSDWYRESENKKVSRKYISKIAKEIEWDVYEAAAIAYDLLEDVNFHGAAKALSNYVQKDYNS